MTTCLQPNAQSTPDQNGEKSGAEKCIFVIFNPVSGKGDPEARQKTISDALARHGHTCQFIATSKEEGAAALAKKAVENGVDLLVVSGGDGTVVQAMSALVGTDIPIAVLPAGTGNLLSVNLGIPTAVPEAVDVALSGHRYALDLARTESGRYFAIMGGLGMDAQMIADADRKAKSRFGVFAYFWAALKNLRRRRAYVEIALDGKPPLRRRVKTAIIANMGRVTGGLEAMPTAMPNDGLLDVGLLEVETLGEWLHLALSALLGWAQDDPELEVYQAKKITIRTPFPEPVQFDGEDGGRTCDLAVEVVPNAVQVLIPEGTPTAEDSEAPPGRTALSNARGVWPLACVALGVVGIALLRRYRRG